MINRREFEYHPPTEETAPKYAAIRKAEEAAVSAICNPEATFASVNAACLAFALVIDEHAPDRADKAAAIRCVRLARNFANEYLAHSGISNLEAAVLELRKARFQANAAIALEVKQ